MKSLTDIPHLESVRVLVRADFNVPIIHGAVADDFRIKAALPTLEFLRRQGARVILLSHLEGADGENPTLEPVRESLQKLGVPVNFVKSIRNARQAIDTMTNGSCILLENIRVHEGEKKNDRAFAAELASLGDIYVNDAFSVSHREHASVVSLPKLMAGYAGLQLEKEIQHLSKAFEPTHPFVFVLGGAKFDTKLPLIKKFIGTADTVFIGGALANDALKSAGHEIGVSKTSNGNVDISEIVRNPHVMLPVDVVVQDHVEKSLSQIDRPDRIFDAGSKTYELLREKISVAQFILWNGPLGLYEDGYQGATLEVATMVGEATARGAYTVVGGGDTLAAIATLGIQEKFSFISTGGGAMLDFLATGMLPGIEALQTSPSVED